MTNLWLFFGSFVNSVNGAVAADAEAIVILAFEFFAVWEMGVLRELGNFGDNVLGEGVGDFV